MAAGSVDGVRAGGQEERLFPEGQVLAHYDEVRRKKGPAVVAVAHTSLLLAYQVLSTGKPYQDRQAPALEIVPDGRGLRGLLQVAVIKPRRLFHNPVKRLTLPAFRGDVFYARFFNGDVHAGGGGNFLRCDGGTSASVR